MGVALQTTHCGLRSIWVNDWIAAGAVDRGIRANSRLTGSSRHSTYGQGGHDLRPSGIVEVL